jgi:glycosyltransferase involved in cell wall biosynthesis
MKVFFILSRFPYPLEKGDKLRAYYFIREISRKHEVILYAISDDKVSNEQLGMLKPYCSSVHVFRKGKLQVAWSLLKTFFSSKPLQTGYFYSAKAKLEIDSILSIQQPDVIFCQLIRVAEYVKNQPFPAVLDYMDAFSKGMQRRIQSAPFYLKPVFKLEWKRLLRYESEIFDSFVQRTIISKPDREMISHPGKAEIIIIPNGVDLQHYSSAPEQEKEFDLVFTGNMSYPPNVAGVHFLVQQILPLLLDEFPGLRILISGATPVKSILAYEGKNVHVTGWVDDMRVSYRRSGIFVAALHIGSGMQNKVLEAMASRLPCIVSGLVNNALSAREGEEILTAESAEDFAGKIKRLLRDPEAAQRLADGGYNFVKKNYEWSRVGELLDQTLEETAAVSKLL